MNSHQRRINRRAKKKEYIKTMDEWAKAHNEWWSKAFTSPSSLNLNVLVPSIAPSVESICDSLNQWDSQRGMNLVENIKYEDGKIVFTKRSWRK